MNKKDIIDAYLMIRKTNNTISDEVLDFMKDAAIEKLGNHQTNALYNQSKEMDDYEFNLKRGWKEEEDNKNNDGGIINHFQ